MSDPYLSDVTLLLPFDGSLTDLSSSARSVTAYNSAVTSSTQAKFGTQAAYFPTYTAPSTNLTTPTASGASYQITGVFTAEGWFRANSIKQAPILFSLKDAGNGIAIFYDNNNGKVLSVLDYAGGIILSSSFTPTIGTFYHVAVVRDVSNNLYLYANGNLVGSTTYTYAFPTVQTQVYLSDPFNPFDGNIDEFRLSGFQRYSGSTYTIPSSAFGTNVGADIHFATVTLLLAFDGSVTDLSTGALTVTTSGSGSSFDSTNKVFGADSLLLANAWPVPYISTAVSTGSSFQITAEFTIEGWFYLPANPITDSAIVTIYDGITSTGVLVNAAGTMGILSGGTGFYETSTASLNTWYHFALQRDAFNNFALYFNGNLLTGATPFNGLSFSSAQIYIGSDVDFKYPFNGYVDEVRVTGNGINRYSGSTYTIPTAAFDFPGPSVALTGQAINSAQGSATSTITTAIAGQVISIGQGTIRYPNIATITGQSLTISQGLISESVAPILTGQSTTSSQGSVAKGVGITGQSISVSQGSIREGLVTAITGQSATSNQGSVVGSSMIVSIGSIVATLPAFSALLYGGGVIATSLPSYSALLLGAQSNNALTAILPNFIAQLYGGGIIVTTLPSYTAVIRGFIPSIGRINAALPGFYANIQGYSGVLGYLNAALPFLSAQLYGGGIINTSIPSFTVSAKGVVSVTGTLTGALPSLSAILVGNGGLTATLIATLPSFTAEYGFIFAQLPPFIVQATETAITQPLTAYSMNIKTGETTTYSNFNFQYIIRLGFNFYGVRPDGIYQLTGTTDNGAFINAKFKTAQSYYSVNAHKRAAKVYLDTENYTYVQPTIDTVPGIIQKSEQGGRRVNLGRGYSGKIWEFEISNVFGAPMRIGAMEILFDELSRRVGGSH